jgi:NTP pyrophosphatase (non-canonical NTP hydrolase)
MNQYYLEGLNALAATIHDRNIRLGFYDPILVRDLDGMLMNVVGELAEAQEEWRKGRGPNETYFMVNVHAGDESLRVRHEPNTGRLQVRNYDWDYSHGDRNQDEPEWLDLTPERLRTMPNMIRHCKPEGIPSELADAIIRILDIAAFHGIDIAHAVADKMAYNETRPYRHGNKLS